MHLTDTSEIPVLISLEQSAVPTFSTTELYCEAAIEHALSED
jgi:aspartate/glutamate racemase